MEDADQRLRHAINLIIKAGYQLNAGALTYLKTAAQSGEIESFVNKAITALAKSPEKPLFLTREHLESGAVKKPSVAENKAQEVAESVGPAFKPYAKEVVGKVEVLDDPTSRVGSEGKIEEYLNHFKDRFKKIERIMRERSDVKDAVSIGNAREAPLNSKIKTIGLVTEKRERKRTVFVQIEDYESNLTVIVPSTSSREVFEKTKRIFIDQVVCVEATKVKDDLFIAKDFISPDIPERRLNTASEQVYAAFLSDIHVGSKKFLEEDFTRFLGWLKGSEGNSHQREVASRIKYLVIAGDIVDGIGIYPNQEKELAVTDIYEQYNIASKFIQEIPEYIEVIIIPGNHDATRQALPQPAIFRKYAESIYNLKNVKMLGDPARVRLHGVDVLVFHGTSLDDIVGAAPDVTYLNLGKEINTAMRYLLKTRHLAPIYGAKTPIAPTPVDDLVINPPPDILHTGHVHVMGYEVYRGTLMINSSTWQGQTDFQEKMGLTPMPGIVPIVDLKSLKVMPINFLS